MIGAIILALTVSSGVARARTGCGSEADVTFLLDSSGNIGQQNFQKQVNFINDITNDMDVSPGKVQVGALTFGGSVSNIFYLNQYTNKSTLQNAILNIPYSGGKAKLADAIRYATMTSFSPSHGGRGDVPHVTVLITNQASGSIDMTKLESQTARDNGIIIYTVGIGNGIDMHELQAITSDPDSRHMFTAQNFDALNSLSDLLATKICNELPPNPNFLPAPKGCLHKADIVFMVDSSSSVGNTNFQKLEHFLKDVVSKVDVAPDKVEIGMVKYGNYPSVEFTLGQYLNRPTMMKAIEGMTYIGGGTNDADAIRYTGQQVFSQNSGARGDVPRIAVIVTDGGSADSNAAIAAADKARTENIGTIVVGVGNRINNAELSRIADAPSNENLLTVRNYDDLDSITDKLIERMCKVQATQPSLTTSAPGGTLPPDPCQDSQVSCDQYGKDVCTNYVQWARTNCARSCGFCTPLYTAAPPPCTDTLPNCTNQDITECSKPGSFVQSNCPRFCGMCGVNTSSTGYYGKCSYKEKAYSTGESWFDGCDYECICEDGNTGKYKCNNRCPVYRNLPQDCTLITQPADCCLQPVCNFNPTVNVQQSSGHAVTSNGIDVCVYRGKQYFQRQSWRDGCDYHCTCTDATSGLFQCEDLCPVYSSIPPYCHLEQPIGECCKKPVCEFDTHSGSFTGSGSISGYGIARLPTSQPVCIDVNVKCRDYGKAACVTYRSWALTNCRQYCDMCDEGAVAPGPNDHCVHSGKLYQQGDSWNTTCDTVCTCENAVHGYYRCVNTCPAYNNLPTDCHVVKKSGECCAVVQCQNGYFYSSSNNLGSLGNGASLSVINPPAGMSYVQPTLPTSEILHAGAGSTGFSAPKISGCMYKGQLYVQDQAWEDGCELSCICRDAGAGLYSCKYKCPSYPALPASCQLVRDHNDECCQVPQCSRDPVTHQVPVPLPVFRPASQTHNEVKPPHLTDTDYGHYSMTIYLAQTGLTPPLPTQPAVVPTGGIGYCMYSGKRYHQGELWEDGCIFNCICEDASRGHYNCLEKCVHYGVLPKHCYLKTDPTNPCCDIPICNIPVNFGGHFGEVTTTLRPKGEYCVYKGQKYQHGQTWYDGCSYKCTCEDATNNLYRCMSRCLEYENIAENCSFVADPRDPGCCRMPECPTTGSTAVKPVISGTYTGHTMTTGFCEYKGAHYGQDQHWSDGCELDCQCTDSQSGFFRCRETCARYTKLPVYCTLVTDFTNPCCKTPRCNFPASTQSVTGSMAPTTQLVPTPVSPGQTPSMVSGTYPLPHYKYCVYKQVQYSQGETWNDGCDYRCRCDDADMGLYTCSQRCASYEPVAVGCSMVTNPQDSCCLVPYCTPHAQSTAHPVPGSPLPTPYRIPTYRPGYVTGSASRPKLRPDMTLPPLSYCEYKGQQYHLHEKWDDGCDFMCECVDDVTGKYTCTEKCPVYVHLPSNCRLVKDAANPCCKRTDCSPTPSPPAITGPGFTPSSTPPTQRPDKVCVYKEKTYTEGQQWFDGCDYACLCEDGERGLYTCNDRCPSFNSLPAECKLVPSADDPICCKEVKCNFPRIYNTTGYFIPSTLPTGVVTGGHAAPPTRTTIQPSPMSIQPSGLTLSPTPAGSSGIPPIGTGITASPTPAGFTLTPPYVDISTPTSTPLSTCVYKNNFYQQGQAWQDGCEYRCECLNAATGQYKCSEMCPKYSSMTLATCKLVTDPYNPCCKIPYCRPVPLIVTPSGPTPVTTVATPGCMYNGVRFIQGQQWSDGCDLQCVCEDQKTGVYKCRDRCNTYDVPLECTSMTDPRDSCCKVPNCRLQTVTPGPPILPHSGPTPAPTGSFTPTPAPTGSFTPTPAPIGSFTPTPAPTGSFTPTPAPTGSLILTVSPAGPLTPIPVTGKFDVYHVSSNRSGCVDDGIVHKTGDKWQQGCKYNCVCLENTGRYQCTDRCPLYMNLPTSCRLEIDPLDACCKVPVCHTQAPIPSSTPSSGPTPTGLTGTTPDSHGSTPPNPRTTPNSHGSNPVSSGTAPMSGGPSPSSHIKPSTTPASRQTGCFMDGGHYVAGQSWYSGCNQKCVCEDGKTGLYRCFDRCAKYTAIPSNCTLVPDPNDPACCKVPQCIPVPVLGQTRPTGSPVMVTGVTGMITGTLPTPLTGTRNYCVYKGRTYAPGQKWQDDCQYNCVCANGQTGKYICTQRCATFPIVPPQCYMQRDRNDICCFKPICDFSKIPTPFPPLVSPSTSNVSTVVQPPVPSSFCVYRGVAYRQGQTWDIGCQKKCRCDESDNNIYTCFDRCKTYNNLGDGCVMVSDPTDACCQIPNCVYIPNPQSPPTGQTMSPTSVGHSPQSPTAFPPMGQSVSPTPAGHSPQSPTAFPPTDQSMSPTPAGHSHQSPNPVAATVCANPVPTAVPGVINGSPLPDPRTGALSSNIGYCEYKGSQYKQYAFWEDGCSYNCKCIDASSGRYQCQEKCPRYVHLPAYCKMVQDPSDKCCTKPSCNACPQNPTPHTYSQVSGVPVYPPTPSYKDACVMNGKQYSEGQKWYVGCDKTCICDDQKTGIYSCYDRCPSYAPQAGCRLVPDPRDPVCCQVPSCPGSSVMPVYGNTTGFGTAVPPTGSSITSGMCVYKGKMYGQYQRWQDGCQYNCVCNDAITGHFQCTDRCARYPNLPPTCHLVHDPSNPCCQKPVCQSTSLPPTAGPDGKVPTLSQTELCVYQGVPLRQGQTFNQGCDKTCKCEDARTGKITCTDRCPTYPALTPNCNLVTDPGNECCQVPFCIDKGRYSTNVTGVLGSVYGHSLPIKNQFSGIRNGCVYNGKLYNQGQTWDDGCTYTCECLDMSTGQYRCTQICPRYPSLPTYCTLIQDPANRCCQKPDCQQRPTPPINPSLSPNTTVSPLPSVCIYGGNSYQEGQQWYDGCKFVCQCDNARSNMYTCRQRCPVYNTIPQGCLLVADPKDPSCCEMASCPILPKPTIGIIVAPQPIGTIIGVRPTSVTGSTNPGQNKAGCLYKGTLLYQGQRFDDGCNYECECLDNSTGRYRCSEKCSTYKSLPKECILVQDPKKPCCQVPYCDFVNHTPFLTGYPTALPRVTPTPQTGVIVIKPYQVPPRQNYGTHGYCVYKSVYYTQGQTWTDGCDLKCMCENVTTGYYSCSQRCPLYPPTLCPRRTSPDDSCCLLPDCNTGKIPATVYPPGSSQSTVNPIIKPTPLTGGYFIGGSVGGSGEVPYQTGSAFTGSTSGCVYAGAIYKQGDTWTDGCKYNCECIDVTHGQYKCTQRCPQYPFVPAQCHFKPSKTDVCCQEVECDVYGSSTVTPSTKLTVPPTPSIRQCVYVNGMKYTQGTVWQDGCATCQCQNATINAYLCRDRCPIYSGLPSFCTLVNDHTDQCNCKKPSCSPTHGLTLTPVTGNATYTPTSLSVLPLGTHHIFSGYGRPIGGTGSVIGGRSVCVYKGSLYSQGQSWQDSCKFVCSCENGTTGLYRCASKCPDYPSLPSYCKLLSVPGQCCASIVCDLPGYGIYHPVVQLTNATWYNYSGGGTVGGITVISVPGSTGFIGGSRYPGGGYYLPNATLHGVLANLRDKCIYKKHLYNQGDVWNIGCEYRCQCMDSTTGYYVCRQLCPVYSNLPSNICYLVKTDSHCCSEPKCLNSVTGKYVNPFNSTTEFPVVGTYSGGFSGFRPLSYPGHLEFSASSKNGCYYKGSIYNKNDNWDDNCDFSCTCLNVTSGLYSCTPKCPTYTNLPGMCRMETSSGSCCKTIVCDHQLPIGPTHPPVINTRPHTQCPGLHPFCHDKIDNCRDYGTQACNSPYKAWAKRNCPYTCRYCDCSEHGTSLQVCEDKLNDCKDFGKASCSGIYETWARDNCKLYCGYCPTTPATHTSTSPPAVTTAACVDVLGTCSLLDTNYFCKGDYRQYGYDNCRKTCNMCHETSPVTVSTTALYTGSMSYSVTSVGSTSSTTTPRPYEVCNYKGIKYGQGRTWNDGLKSCSCEDASIGYFKCTDRCPHISDIPSICKIVQVPGSCPRIDCPLGVTVTTSRPFTIPGLCEYRGRYYSQDQTWNDSCRQSCTCTNAANGIYICRSVCMNFSMLLPSECSLDDAPEGMCCKQPKCPTNIPICIRLAYKAEYPGYSCYY